MKKTLLLLSVGAIVMFSAPTGCIKSTGTTSPLSQIPDLSNFLVQASTAFKTGAAAYIKILSTSLGDGTFNVNFNLTGSNSGSSTATLTMSGGSGTFTIPAIYINSDGPTTVTVTSVSKSGGSGATPTGNNTSSMFDSTGLMNATYTPAGGSAQTLKATDVTASWLGSGSILSIHGVIWTPNLTTITLYYDNYTGAVGTPIYFNSNDASSSNGSAAYGVSGSSGVITDLSQHGTITINTFSTLVTGTFTYTNQDSSVVAGTFSCPHP